MKFCASFLKDINIEPHGFQPCCDVHGAKVPLYVPGPDGFRGRDYARHIQEVIAAAQDPADPLCKGCAQLEEIPDPDGETHARLGFRSVSINVHRYLCNCRCVYCNLWKQKYEPVPIMPVLRRLEEEKILAPDCFFSWGGGEPSILPEFEEAATWIRERGHRQIVHTNAIRYSPAIASLLEGRRNMINISLDSGTREGYKKVKGVDRFGEVMETLKAYAAADSSGIALKYIIFEANNSLPEIERFLDICRRLNVGEVEYSLDFREINGAGPSLKTLVAAAFFQRQARRLDIKPRSFFIPPKWLKGIEDAGMAHLPR